MSYNGGGGEQMVPYNGGGPPPGAAVAAGGGDWSKRFPVYQIDFQAHASGKKLAATKRRIRWRFGFPNKEALNNGETGTACRGEEHDVTIVWSVTSGKRLVLADGHEVHYSTNRSSLFEFSWTMRGNHVLKILAHAAPPLSATPGFRQYDFFVDGQSFFHMPKVYELGIKGPVGTAVRHPGQYHPAEAPAAGGQPRSAVAAPGPPPQQQYRNYDLSTGQYTDLPAPSTREQEEAELQAAIKASLEESRRHLSEPRALPPSTTPMQAPGGAPPSTVVRSESAPLYDTRTSLLSLPSTVGGSTTVAEDSHLLDLLSEPSMNTPSIDNAPPVNGVSSFDPNSPSYAQGGGFTDSFVAGGGGAPQRGTSFNDSYTGGLASAQPSSGFTDSFTGGAVNYSAPAPPPAQQQLYNGGGPPQQYAPPPPQQQQQPYQTFDPSQPPTFHQIEHTYNPSMPPGSVGGPPPAPVQNNVYVQNPPNGAPAPQQSVDVGASGGDTIVSSVSGDSPAKLSMNAPFVPEEETLEEEPKNAVEKAMKNLVNIDDITAPVEEQMTKLTLNPFADDPKKKPKDKKSKGLAPPAASWGGVQPSLAEMKVMKSSKPQPAEVMKANPSAFQPEAAHAGALVVHGSQTGNYGGYGPPPLEKPTGFGVGAQMGIGYNNPQSQFGANQQQQYQQQQYQQQQQQQQQQQGYGAPPPAGYGVPQQQQQPGYGAPPPQQQGYGAPPPPGQQYGQPQPQYAPPQY